MARRDLTGAVDFAALEAYTSGDADLVEEVLGLFVEQAALWRPLLRGADGWRDAVHTLKGAARSLSAGALAAACDAAEAGQGSVSAVEDALDLTLSDIAAYRHELALRSLKG